MNVYLTKTIGELVISLGVEVDENSQNANRAFAEMKELIAGMNCIKTMKAEEDI